MGAVLARRVIDGAQIDGAKLGVEFAARMQVQQKLAQIECPFGDKAAFFVERIQ